MRIVVAPNAFKECLSAKEVAEAIAKGVQTACPDAEVITVPLADGGDGTMDALVACRQGESISLRVNDPLMRLVEAQYGLIDGGKTAVIEMAVASGLWRLQEHDKNPMLTTTFGTGEMIRDALDRGCAQIIVGIGGSATTDAGIGMAAALGYRLLDEHEQEIDPVGGAMGSLVRIDASHVHPRLIEVEIFVACDVTNPLLGPDGAAPVYGPQKGATPDNVIELEKGLSNVSQRWKDDLGVTVADLPGGGAAGGLGAGLAVFCGAQIRSGFDLIADFAQLDQALEEATMVITGEGKIDASTKFGKVPSGVGLRAQKRGIPAIAIAGGYAGDVASLSEQGIMAVFSIVPGPASLESAIQNAEPWLTQAAEQVVRLWLLKN